MKVVRSHTKTKRELRRRRKKFILTSIFLILSFVFFVWLMNQDRFKISSIEVAGTKTILNSDIKKIIKEDLDKKILWMFPRDNVLFTNTVKIENQIMNTFPKIYSASVLIKNGSKLVVVVEEREPHSLWCKNRAIHSSFDEECYFADQKGFIYTRAPYFSDGVFEKIYTTKDVLKIGEQVLSKDDFTKFFKFTEILFNEFGIIIDRIFINKNGEIRIYIRSLLKKSFFENKPYIIYHNGDSYQLLIRNIGIMVNHELFKKEFKEYSERLEFIDLRILDQVRYKFTPPEEFIKKQKKSQEKENDYKQQKTKYE